MKCTNYTWHAILFFFCDDLEESWGCVWICNQTAKMECFLSIFVSDFVENTPLHSRVFFLNIFGSSCFHFFFFQYCILFLFIQLLIFGVRFHVFAIFFVDWFTKTCFENATLLFQILRYSGLFVFTVFQSLYVIYSNDSIIRMRYAH